MDRRPVTEIGVSALIAVICTVFYIQALKLPPGTFEPLGSGPVPKYTAAVIILCCFIVMARAALALVRGPGLLVTLRREFGGGPATGAVVMLGFSITYIGLLHLQVASFGVITFGFLTLLIWAMESFRSRVLLPALVTAAIASFGAEYLFTNVFVVDLPT